MNLLVFIASLIWGSNGAYDAVTDMVPHPLLSNEDLYESSFVQQQQHPITGRHLQVKSSRYINNQIINQGSLHRIMEESSDVPSTILSDVPSTTPSDVPSDISSDVPSNISSNIPSTVASDTPSTIASNTPSTIASNTPSNVESNTPSTVPSTVPSDTTSDTPSNIVSAVPTVDNGIITKDILSDTPSTVQSTVPSFFPSDSVSIVPSSIRSDVPSDAPSDLASSAPSDSPSDTPSDVPSTAPSPSDPIIALTLVESETGKEIIELHDGDVIQRIELGTNTTLTIVVETTDIVETVEFTYNTTTHIEGVPPYAMFGKMFGGSIYWPVEYLSTNGNKTVKVEAFDIAHTKIIDEVIISFTIE